MESRAHQSPLRGSQHVCLWRHDFGQRISQRTGLTKKKAYFQELMDMYDTRLKNLDALNSFTKPDKRATKGDILARKAFDYAYYGAGVADGYSLDKATPCSARA